MKASIITKLDKYGRPVCVPVSPRQYKTDPLLTMPVTTNSQNRAFIVEPTGKTWIFKRSK